MFLHFLLAEVCSDQSSPPEDLICAKRRHLAGGYISLNLSRLLLLKQPGICRCKLIKHKPMGIIITGLIKKIITIDNEIPAIENESPEEYSKQACECLV